MRPDDGSLPGRRMAQERLARARQAIVAAPLPVKILLVIALLIIVVLGFSLGPRVLDLVLLIIQRHPHEPLNPFLVLYFPLLERRLISRLSSANGLLAM